ncbi:MAG: hypothetical protein HFJ29_01350 [Clostridia bacterium]|nr:hypothetical protein [Clostridia bacterium]
MEKDKGNIDFESFLKCLELAFESNFSWCLDCKREECIVQKSGIIDKRY